LVKIYLIKVVIHGSMKNHSSHRKILFNSPGMAVSADTGGPTTDFNMDTYQPMPVAYELRYMMLRKLRAGEDPLPDIEGRDETKKDVIRAVLSGGYPYLVSREGTGKTRLAESLAKLLPPVPKIKGCPYNCDPKWPEEWKCPACQGEDDLEIAIIRGKQRYSRIQGNEYTNEAKILGVKDLQAIVQGDSPTDPRAFIGTGVLRGNRGVVCVDELPAIPTKVQVLFHPMLQERRIVLEEYNWVRPIDIFFVATGNPAGFSHVNRVPEPLLDRLELIPMGLPEEAVEREIMFKEGFRVIDDFFTNQGSDRPQEPISAKPTDLKRQAAAPWWIVDVVTKAARYTRDCPNIDRGASIRGSIKSLDHTISSAELRGAKVASLGDAADGLKLGLRGRIRLRADLVGFDDSPSAFMSRNNEVVEDIIWYATRDVGKHVLAVLSDDINVRDMAEEVDRFLSAEPAPVSPDDYPLLDTAINLMRELKTWESPALVNGLEQLLRENPAAAEPEDVAEYQASAVELLANTMLAEKVTQSFAAQDKMYVPRRMT
jgi:MoxR-like ATPase